MFKIIIYKNYFISKLNYRYNKIFCKFFRRTIIFIKYLPIRTQYRRNENSNCKNRKVLLTREKWTVTVRRTTSMWLSAKEKTTRLIENKQVGKQLIRGKVVYLMRARIHTTTLNGFRNEVIDPNTLPQAVVASVTFIGKNNAQKRSIGFSASLAYKKKTEKRLSLWNVKCFNRHSLLHQRSNDWVNNLTWLWSFCFVFWW